MPRLLPSLFLCASLMAGCSEFPALDNAVSASARHADYPGLLPLDQVAADSAGAEATQAAIKGLAGRAAALRARAARLRGPVIDDTTRARLQAALARHP